MIACRRASWPTRRSPCGVKATTEGVVRDPSALGTTVGLPASVVAMTELVVPRSIPTAIAIAFLLPGSVSPRGSQTNCASAVQTHVPRHPGRCQGHTEQAGQSPAISILRGLAASDLGMVTV